MAWTKRIFLCSVLAIFCLTLFSSCDFDPYKGKRPIDYDGSSWISEGTKYYMYFEVGNMEESILRINNGDIIHFDFLWSAFYATVNVYEYGKSGYNENLIFVGECTFSENKFEIKVLQKSELYTELPDILVFDRKE